MAVWLALPLSLTDHDVSDSNPTGGGIQLLSVRFIAQILLFLPFRRRFIF